MTLHVGIVCCSAEGAALCYRTICNEAAHLMGEHAHPEVSTHTPSLSHYIQCLDHSEWRGVGDLMLASARKLQSIGAQLLICPDNTIHQAFPYVKERSTVPWLHIGEVVAEAARERGHCKLGIMGTRWLVDGDVYPTVLQKNGLEYARTSTEDLTIVHNIIIGELGKGMHQPDSLEALLKVINRLRDLGCDAVILGCTELPLVINDSNSPLPVLDSTRLLARAAIQRALSVDDATAAWQQR